MVVLVTRGISQTLLDLSKGQMKSKNVILALLANRFGIST